jgi:DNA-binding response OmpR family regulator
LTRAGYNVDVAQDGETALNFLAKGGYAAMTLDLMLPDRSGVMLIRQIRSRPETEALPIIVVSAFSDEGRLAVNGDFAAIDWLDKPIDEARLTAALRRSLPGAWPGKPRVLHVEDDPDLHRIVAAMAHGIADLDVARSLAEARIKLAEQAYALVVLDIGLPDGSGWELLPQLKLLDPEPPVIVLSGAETSPAQRAAVHSALLKSQTSHQDLLDTIQRLIAAQPPGDPTP